MWASRHTLPAPCRQQHRYLTQHVSSLSLSLSGGQSATISGCARLLLLTKRFKYFRTPALSKLMSTIQGQISSQPEPQHFQIDLKGSGGILGMLVIFVAVQSFQTEMHSWRRGRGADLSLRPKGCLVHHLCWPRTQSHTLVSLNKLVCQSVAMSFKRS